VPRTAFVSLALWTAMLAACATGHDGDVNIGSGQSPDPVVLDVPIAYVRSPLPADLADLDDIDVRELETFEAGKESIGIFEAGAEGGAFDPKVLITAKAGSMIHDLHLSPDGRKLSYVRTFPTATAPELDVVDLATRQDRVWLSGNPSAGNDLFSRGWLAGGSVVVLRGSANADWSFRVEVVRIRQDAVEVVGTIDRCFPGTARLDTKTNTLYVTKLDEGSIVQNLVAFSLDQRILTRVTDATLPGVSFAGVEVLPNGQLLYAQQERADGLYRVHFDSASKGT